MSRVGRKAISISSGVNVDLTNNSVEVSGPKGKLQKPIPSGIEVVRENGEIRVTRKSEEKKFRALHGLTRALISNMVAGVTGGFTQSLDIVGVGYKAELIGKSAVKFSLGYSHPVEFSLPQGVSAALEERGTRIIIQGIDKELVGETAAKIKRLRSPDSYKGKGIKYTREKLKLKAGKAGGKK